MRSLILIFGLAFAACSDGANTQYLPIGSRCSSSGDCGTKPYSCNTGFPQGYCEKTCSTDMDCPNDALCFAGVCRRKCGPMSGCRTGDGYQCSDVGLASGVCVVNPAAVDGGTTD